MYMLEFFAVGMGNLIQTLGLPPDLLPSSLLPIAYQMEGFF